MDGSIERVRIIKAMNDKTTAYLMSYQTPGFSLNKFYMSNIT